MINKYKKAFNIVEEKIKSNELLISYITAIALLGSVANDEEADGLSDLDILIIIKDGKCGNIPIKIIEILRQVHSEISINYDFPISFLVHTIDDFEKYVSFEYLTHYAFGVCVYPNRDTLRKIIQSILKKRKLTDDIKQAYCIYHLRHIRFNLLRKYVSQYDTVNESSNREFLNVLIDKIIKATDLALNYNNIWSKNKKEIADHAEKFLKFDTKIVAEAISIRDRWKSVSNSEIIRFVPRGIAYLYSLFDIFLSDYIKPTPEENMRGL